MAKFSAYATGIIWFICSLAFGQCCDIFMKILGNRLPPLQLTFLRYAVCVILLLPILLLSRKKAAKTARWWLYVIRGILLLSAMALWCFGLNRVSLSMASLIGFSIPLFLLPLAKLFLREQISTARLTVTIIGFVGIFIAVWPTIENFHCPCLYLLLSATLFATLDVLNRKFACTEVILTNLFYTSLATAIFSFLPASTMWKPILRSDCWPLLCLGCCANLLLFCLIRAFRLIEASAAAPYRYIEFFFSISNGYLFFGEPLQLAAIAGAFVTIPATIILARLEIHIPTKR